MRSEFTPGEVWLDTAGKPIQAHGGGVLRHGGRFYWYGEDKTPPAGGQAAGKRLDVVGVRGYRSDDLLNWDDLGLVMPAVTGDPSHDLRPGGVLERPKVLHNPRTGNFVLWAHVDSADYKYARTGVAVADRPEGPFTYIGSERPCGGESRDMTVFHDHDGQAYLFYSSEMNRVMPIARLSDDFLRAETIVGQVYRGTGDHTGPEAPAVWRRGGRYYLLASWCRGWDPTPAALFVADRVTGPWEHVGNPCVGQGADLTFGCQSTFALPLGGTGEPVILMFDRWNPKNLGDSRYAWLLADWEGSDREQVSVPWRDRWAIPGRSIV